MSPTTPNTTNIRAWVDALRSGRYEQGTRALRAADPWGGPPRHCCLGVACEVAIAHGVDIARVGDVYGGTARFLPAAAMEWLGVPNEDPVLDGVAATYRNDTLRQSFDAIATAIEKEYLGMSPPTPNTTNIRAWVDALRSGAYKQGSGALRKEYWDGAVHHCCLGVACEVAIAHGADIECVDGRHYNGRGGTLPAAAVEWLGIRSYNPELGGETATYRNDSLRQSFEEIADAIESEYLA